MNRREFLNAGGAGAAILTEARASGSVGKGLDLLKPGRSAVVWAHPQVQPVARHFVTAFRELTGQTLEIVPDKRSEGDRPMVVIGDIQTSQTVRELAGRRASKLTPQGILLATVSDGMRPVLVLAGGSREATPGAVGELLNFHLEAGPNHASVQEIDLVENPALRYRIFWNWDHRTSWVRGVRGEQELGDAKVPYLKRTENFLNDFRRVTEFMGEHKLNGLVIYGFLRDRHGGVDSAKELVDHAWDCGVRVLPGIGTSYYGGFYYEGEHQFNMETYVSSAPPEFRFLTPEGKRRKDALCPSRPENQQWLREGAAWLFSEIPKLGGANLENGDFLACRCSACQHNRQNPDNDPNFYYDMVATQLPIIQTARNLLSDPWMIYATYTGFNPQEIWKHTDKALVRSAIPKFVSQLPEDTICQWTCTHMVQGWGEMPENEVRKKWPAGLRPPTKHSVVYLHQGGPVSGPVSWWTKSPRGHNTLGRYGEVSELLRYTSLRCAEEGIEGVITYGEVSDASPANELNYLAFEEFTWRPHGSMDDFIRNRLSWIYGSQEDARRFVRMVRSQEQSLTALLKNLNEAEEISQNRQYNVRQRRRWANLRAEIARRISLL